MPFTPEQAKNKFTWLNDRGAKTFSVVFNEVFEREADEEKAFAVGLTQAKRVMGIEGKVRNSSYNWPVIRKLARDAVKRGDERLESFFGEATDRGGNFSSLVEKKLKSEDYKFSEFIQKAFSEEYKKEIRRVEGSMVQCKLIASLRPFISSAPVEELLKEKLIRHFEASSAPLFGRVEVESVLLDKGKSVNVKLTCHAHQPSIEELVGYEIGADSVPASILSTAEAELETIIESRGSWDGSEWVFTDDLEVSVDLTSRPQLEQLSEDPQTFSSMVAPIVWREVVDQLEPIRSVYHNISDEAERIISSLITKFS